MNLRNLTADQTRRYFESRLQGQRLASRSGNTTARCPFHDDRTPSMSLNFDKGVWHCHACKIGGGLLQFEIRFSSCDEQTAVANIAEIIGAPQLLRFSRSSPEAVYQYTDEFGRLLFEVLRYPGKRFTQRRPDVKGGWEYQLGNVRRPLYRLPEVVTANEVIICEGEKDVERVRSHDLGAGQEGVRLAVTSNCGGAGKWQVDYSPYLTGKKVVILPDNDEIGYKHAEQIAASVYKYAAGVKIVKLPDLPSKGDVSDYLGSHGAEDLINEIRKAPVWVPDTQGHSLLIPAPQFLNATPVEVDFLVEGLIQRGANGFICANPKAGKSWAAVDLSLSLALGSPWLGFNVRRRAKVALVSREDNPALTGWRMRHLLAGKGCRLEDLQDWMYVNSRGQSPELMLDNDEQMRELVTDLKALQAEFLILDVFNVLHAADENDNTEMRRVLSKLTAIQNEVGCSICVVHHFNKAVEGTMTQRLRGSSAIAGWAEWLIGISLADAEARIRRMEFEVKVTSAPDPIHYRIESDSSAGWAKLEKTEYVASTRGANRSRAERVIGM